MKKGFTLVEILAVIIIMGIIGGLLIVNIQDITSRTTDKTILESAKGLIRSAEVYIAEQSPLGEGECANVNLIENENSDKLKGGEYCISNGNIYLKHVNISDTYISGFSDTLETYKQGEKYVAEFKHLSNEYPTIFILTNKDDSIINYLEDYKKTVEGINRYDVWSESSDWLLDNSMVLDDEVMDSDKIFNLEDYN